MISIRTTIKILMRTALAGFALCAASLCSAFCFTVTPYSDRLCDFSTTVGVYEYVNSNTLRRILLSDPFELDFVDRGLAGPGWHRTSMVLSMLPADYNQSYVKQLVDICRFYAPSVNSHFFSSNAFECALLKEPGTGWIFERVAFKADPPVNGVCPAWSPIPVFRYYNNRAAYGDTTHRYSPDRSLKSKLEADGWIDEGIGFCAVNWSQLPVKTYTIDSDRVVPQGNCETATGSMGGCIEVNQQAQLSRVIYGEDTCLFAIPYLGRVIPPYLSRTGVCSNYAVHTAIAAANHEEVAAHSFVQTYVPMIAFASYGIYVNSRDINSAEIAATSINPKFQFQTQPPVDLAAPDLRVMPWKDGIYRDVEISFNATVRTLRRGADGHAIAHPTIELIDTRSRRNVYLTIGTISGEPQADFSARDFGIGKPIISTTFRADPAFGVRLAGNTFICNTNGPDSLCDQKDNTFFKFRLRPADIASVVERASKLDPAISRNIADYAIDNFSFNTEVSGDAEIGLNLRQYTLQIYVP